MFDGTRFCDLIGKRNAQFRSINIHEITSLAYIQGSPTNREEDSGVEERGSIVATCSVCMQPCTWRSCRKCFLAI